MSGRIKVAGDFTKAISSIQVKVGGVWRYASTAQVKVGGTWRQWFVSLITDAFTRTTTGSLGQTPSGIAWTNLFGAFFANGSQAQSNSSGVSTTSAGALAYVPLGLTDTTTSASVNPGTGVSVWVTAAGSWWGSIAYSTQTSSTYSYSCNPYTACYSCSQNYCADCSHITCNACATTTYSASDSYYGAATVSYSCSTGTVGSAIGLSANRCYSSSTTYSCPAGQYLGNGSSYAPSTTSCYRNSNDQYVGPATANTTYSDIGGASSSYSCSGGTHQCAGAPYSCCTYSCNSGDTISGSTCSNTPNPGTAPNNCNCGTTSSTYTPALNSCTCNSPDTGGGLSVRYSYPTPSACSCPSGYTGGGSYTAYQTCTGTTYTNHYYTQIIYSSSTGAGYTVYSTSPELAGAAAAIKVTTSGNTLTSQAYSDTGLTTTLGSAQTATNTGTKGTNFGIVMAYSPNLASTTVDNFSTGA
jgi:hypothetical protein